MSSEYARAAVTARASFFDAHPLRRIDLEEPPVLEVGAAR
jgi:hypothetical protein